MKPTYHVNFCNSLGVCFERIIYDLIYRHCVGIGVAQVTGESTESAPRDTNVAQVDMFVYIKEGVILGLLFLYMACEMSQKNEIIGANKFQAILLTEPFAAKNFFCTFF